MKINNVYRKSSKIEITVLIIICIQFALMASGQIGIPFWFMKPTLECENNFQCSQIEACNQPNNMRRLQPNTLRSVVFDLEMYCDQTLNGMHLLALIIAIFPLTSAFWSVWPILPSQRGYYLCGFFFVCGCISIYISQSNNPLIIMAGLVLYRFLTKSYYVNVFTFVTENFSEGLVELASCTINLFFGVGTVSLAIFFYFYPDWRQVFLYYAGLPMVITSCLLFYVLNKHHFFPCKETDQSAVSLKYLIPVNETETQQQGTLCEMLKSPKRLKNTVIFILIYQAVYCTFGTQIIIAGQFYGGIYINICLLGFCDICSGLVAAFFIQKYDGIQLLNISLKLLGFFSLLFFFQNINNPSPNIILIILLIVAVIVIKMSIELSLQFMLSMLDVFMPIKYQQSLWSFMNVFYLVTISIPYLIYFQEAINLNPLVLYGSISLLVSLTTKCIHQYVSAVKDDSFEESEPYLNPLQKPNQFGNKHNFTVRFSALKLMVQQKVHTSVDIEMKKGKLDQILEERKLQTQEEQQQKIKDIQNRKQKQWANINEPMLSKSKENISKQTLSLTSNS